MAATESFGLTLYIQSGTGSPSAYTKLAGVTSMPQLFGFSRSKIDVSEISDEVKQFLGGQADPGEVQMELIFDPNEATHNDTAGLLYMARTRGLFDFVLKIPQSTAAGSTDTYMYFRGVVIEATVSGAQDDVIRANATIAVSGLADFDTTAPNIV